MNRNRIILIIPLLLLFLSGCVWEPGIDKAKFTELNRTAEDLKAVIRSGKPCDLPDSLLQRFTSGTEALKGKMASKEERDILSAYSNLLAIYKDGVLVCQSRSLLSEFEFLPKGRIYVSQELDPVVEKYGLSTQRHLYKPTGMYWKSIPTDSINIIWENAEFEIKHIENMIKYN